MQLYCGSVGDFLAHEAQRNMAERLRVSFLEYYQHEAPRSEQLSWRNSLHALSSQVRRSGLSDNGIILEMQLPLTSRRLDCMLTGLDERAREQAVILELKQWSDAQSVEEEECVLVDYGRGKSVETHPSVQARDYSLYLQDNKAVFHEAPEVRLDACSWLHNMQPDPTSALFEPKFTNILRETPLFTASDGEAMGAFLGERLRGGKGMPVLERIIHSPYRASKKLMEHTAEMIRGEPTYILLDEQKVAYQKIFAAARRAAKLKTNRTVILIKGGPGTGKSVIALNVMADLLKEGFNVQHATGSRAFTGNLRRILGSRATAQLKYFNSYSRADLSEVDVIICDEAHRIRETSNSRFTRAEFRSDRRQVDELVHAAKVPVFFIDDKQVVRPGEVGSSNLIREAAVAAGIERFDQQELVAQFRCGGSDEYIDWVDELLGIRHTEQYEYDSNSDFEVSILPSPELLEKKIMDKAGSGNTARITAGFCWKWSNSKGGVLSEDVTIGANYKRPWNARPDAVGLPRDIPKSDYWATDPNGIGQIGCVYTAQGFEFDYVGVIWGPDLVYRRAEGWVGVKPASQDPAVKRASAENFVGLIKNTYRVLLTRGMRGCNLYFTDPETEEFVQSRISSHG